MIECKKVSFTYETPQYDSSSNNHSTNAQKSSSASQEFILDSVSFTLEPGSRVVVVGSNGSGKSTLANMCNASLLPQSGEVLVDGNATSNVPSTQISSLVGMVRQDPASQIVSTTVFEEVAFGPANVGLPKNEIVSRVTHTLELCGISELLLSQTTALSGGQQQLVAVAAALSLQPHYLVLDEAFAQLDTRYRNHLSRLIDTLVTQQSVGVLEISHSFESIPGAQQVLVLDKGRIVWRGSPTEFFKDSSVLKIAGFTDALSLTAHMAACFGYNFDAPFNLSLFVSFLVEHNLLFEALDTLVYHQALQVVRANNYDGYAFCGEVHELVLKDVCKSFDVPLLKNISFTTTSELVILVGPSGSGKSTCARIAAGLIACDSGQTFLDGRSIEAGAVGICFQRPQDQLFAQSVFEDIAFAPANKGFSPEETHDIVETAAQKVGVDRAWWNKSPLMLSGGQARRVALAGTLACATNAYIFDEATSGLDGAARMQVLQLARDLVNDGKVVLAITHDVSEWLPYADRVVFLDNGSISSQVSALEAQVNPQVYEQAHLDCPLYVKVVSAVLEACHG